MVYSLESFETFINLIYVFLPVITLDTYIHNLHENLRRTKRTLITDVVFVSEKKYKNKNDFNVYRLFPTIFTPTTICMLVLPSCAHL
jgi:hypothetical protein